MSTLTDTLNRPTIGGMKWHKSSIGWSLMPPGWDTYVAAIYEVEKFEVDVYVWIDTLDIGPSAKATFNTLEEAMHFAEIESLKSRLAAGGQP